MTLLTHGLILTLVVVQSMHVYSQDDYIDGFKVKSDPGANVFNQSTNYQLEFFNNWYSRPFNYLIGPMDLRCYALLYKTPDRFERKEIGVIRLPIGTRRIYRFFVNSGAFNHWSIQCDYRNLVASQKSLKQGVVLVSGNDEMCLAINTGCVISFEMGEARRIGRRGTEFLGELPETKCGFWDDCKERPHPRQMFGVPCSGTCDFDEIID